jgi:hypothetical protein
MKMMTAPLYEPEAVPGEEDTITDTQYDQLLNAKVMLPKRQNLLMGAVTGYKRDNERCLVERAIQTSTEYSDVPSRARWWWTTCGPKK